MLIFYDFEVFRYDWMVVFICPYTEETIVIVNDPEKLRTFYEKNRESIFVGYNSRHYDQYIFKAILCGFDAWDINDYIINQKCPGWQYSDLLQKIRLLTYDTAKLNDGGLKTLESYMGNDIQETSVDFQLDRKLTDSEIAETVRYCIHDVEQTIAVFMNRKEDFEAHMGLITAFHLPLSYISKTQVQLAAKILNCVYVERHDEWELDIVPTLRLSKYRFLLDEFRNVFREQYEFWSMQHNIAGVPHSFGFGGVHGARLQYHAKGLLLHVDVTSYYPSLMIRYGFLTRNSRTPEKFKEIYDTRVALKKAGKKAEQAPYKIVLNGTFGISKDPASPAYDPRSANNICVNGQLLLIDLIEKLEAVPGFELVQSNTDGLIIRIPDTDAAFSQTDDICYEWEQRTGMGLGFDVIREIFQKDVNNYVFITEDGGIERKGAYVQKYSPLKNDLTIVNMALVEYMVHGVPAEKTIRECDDLNLFQKVVKISGKYHSAWHNGKKLPGKTFRVFASPDRRDGAVYKRRKPGAALEKFANTPEHCLIYNGEITQDTRLQIDKDYYIALARKRLCDYGIGVLQWSLLSETDNTGIW